MAGTLAKPVMSDLRADPGANVYTVDIEWQGQDNHVDLDNIRTRWASLPNGASAPAPDRDDFIGAAYSTQIAQFTSVGSTYDYVDTLEIATPAQMATDGTQRENNEALRQTAFRNRTVWVSGLLDVDN